MSPPNPAAEAASRLSLDPHGAVLALEIDEKRAHEDLYISSSIRVVVITALLCVGAFLISMDRTIITIAIPYITAEFHSTPGIGWYGSAYLITSCAFLPLFGRLFTISNLKWTYVACLFVFILGSASCSFAPVSAVLILGRAVAGLGSAGMFPGTLIIGARIVRPERRILLMALGGLTMSMGSIVGPVLGGVLTTFLDWRMCFIINLPLGGLLLIAVSLALKLPPTSKANIGWKKQLLSFDFIGAAIILGTAIMLFFALHYAAVGKPFWHNSETLALIAGSAAATILLTFWLWHQGDEAIVPLHLVRARTVGSACIMALGLYGGLTVAIYYLPLFFQAAKENIAIAVLATKTYLPHQTAIALSAIIGGVIAVIGASLLATVTQHSRSAAVTAFQVVFGLGIGLSIQQGQNALQFVLVQDDLSIAMALVQFHQSLGGSLAAAIANTVFIKALRTARPETPAGTDVDAVIAAGTEAFLELPAHYAGSWLAAYDTAFRAVFALAAALVGLAFIGSLFMQTNGLSMDEGRKVLRQKESTRRLVAFSPAQGD